MRSIDGQETLSISLETVYYIVLDPDGTLRATLFQMSLDGILMSRDL